MGRKRRASETTAAAEPPCEGPYASPLLREMVLRYVRRANQKRRLHPGAPEVSERDGWAFFRTMEQSGGTGSACWMLLLGLGLRPRPLTAKRRKRDELMWIIERDALQVRTLARELAEKPDELRRFGFGPKCNTPEAVEDRLRVWKREWKSELARLFAQGGMPDLKINWQGVEN